MKKIAMVTAFLFSIGASAGMTITTVEHVSQLLSPDVLQGNLSFEEESKNPDAIKTDMNAIVAEVKRYDPKGEYCQGGGYHLTPRYSYKDQKQAFIGYSGNLSFGCEFNTIEAYNTLVSRIEKVSAPSVRKTQGALSWGVSEKNRMSVRLGLRSALLRTAKTQSDAFSKETGLTCEVVSLHFGTISEARPLMMKAMAKADSVPTESPIRRDEELTLEATVGYTCSKRVP